MLQEIPEKYETKKVEEQINQFWNETDAYHKTREGRKNGKKFFFVDGPPYTTGHIHMGTAWNKVIKDSILRYRSMNGDAVTDTPGWDMHGLPIEVKVEEKLGFQSKKDIETFGVGNFIQECKSFAIEKKGDMTNQFKALGIWMDWDNPYMTLKDEYIEAAWWVIQKAHEKSLLEEGKRVVNWCPRCETAIADSEVEYMDRDDDSIYVKFPVKGEQDFYVVIWTTTPWTIPSNVAAAVHPDAEYVIVKATREDGKVERLLIGKESVPLIMKRGKYPSHEILETKKGSDLQGLEYTAPLAAEVPAQAEMAHAVYPADYVSLDNTGIVHIAPGHGLDDFNVGSKFGLPIFCPVGSNGSYTKEAGKYAGMNIREANDIIIEDLKSKDLLLSQGKINHRYGHCWRCKTAIIYLATEQWFLDVGKIKDEMLNAIDNEIEWTPDWAGSARFRDWVADARDWCISRQRYWGIPVPIWTCPDCKKRAVFGTKQELITKAQLTGDIELHRPYVDEVTLECECGGKMVRTKDVFDVWFDSAVASFATLGFPGRTDLFEEKWPADFITEGHDQTRGWFYSQLGASIAAFGKTPYKSVLMHGFTMDKDGKKMSKSLGNVVTPDEVIEKYGADVLRAYSLSSSAPWDDLKFVWDDVATVNRTVNILWNVYKFPLPYMVLDNFNPLEHPAESLIGSMREEDKWILSRLQSTVAEVTEAMDEKTLHKALRGLFNFILEDLSRWYIQLIRPRTWTEANDPDKLAVYATLYETYVTIAKLSAPFMPYLSETMYQNLVKNIDENAPLSVHMNDWPAPKEIFVNAELEEHMEIVRNVVEASSNARQKAGRKLRWPISRIVVVPTDEAVAAALTHLRDVLLEQTNAKDVEVLAVGEAWKDLDVQMTPNQSVLGPTFKQDAKKVSDALIEAGAKSLKEVFDRVEEMELSLADGTTVTITADMVIFEELIPEGIAGSDSDCGMVYVDAKLTKELESEGYTREVIRRIQDMRKELNLAVDDQITAAVLIKDQHVSDLIKDMTSLIATEVRAGELILNPDAASGDLIKEWDIEGIQMTIGISGKKA
ncbi:isoleucine--tRNA ligase [Methanimicrococcus blatticola]|uniref:Isoleucine--tRNA ligase n=1 Tax=Methanimicrococcus blatticola TaxID=91560 RepID=A0A484F7B4_9EURY|nr:isoleucine--tRNA ligase [Methanimicrococcus blatticola]MBZ3934847.1 isoleucine--tRNA ligase [Methanimicrococcus blatticola]MCC2509055.1 isoleucine--tRNA ligase [Methanimicrococcus blatticola]TDQ70921.1 isoleucyl-tRNA synthetase [Methanimicrococcus blatticola]